MPTCARAVFADKVARPLGLALEHAAYGAHRIAAANMIRAIRAVSIERGRDPRDYALCAFGGNGPVFACAMARELGMRRIVVPPAPGLFSAFGLLYADVEHHYGRTFRRLLRQLDLGALNEAWDHLIDSGARTARRPRASPPRGCASSGRPACTTRGRPSTSPCRCPWARSIRPRSPALEEAFGQEHERTYGHRAGPEEPVELTEIRVIGQGIPERPLTPQAFDLAADDRRRPLAATARLLRPGDRLARHPGHARGPPSRRPTTAPASSRNTTPPASSRPARAPSLDDAGNILIRI